MKSDSASSELRGELAALKTVADALASLPDTEARARVLRWAAERFLVPLAASSARSATVPAPKAAAWPPQFLDEGTSADLLPALPNGEADLTVEDLKDLFEPVRPAHQPMGRPAPVAAASAPPGGTGVVSMIHGFVEDFQQLARAWQKE